MQKHLNNLLNGLTVLFLFDSFIFFPNFQKKKKIALKISSRLRPPQILKEKNVTLDDFDFLRVLGKGTSAKVLLCVEKKTGHYFAVKVIKKADLTKKKVNFFFFFLQKFNSLQIKINYIKKNSKKSLQGASLENRILREIHHPFIVELHYAFQREDKLYFVMVFFFYFL